MRSIRMRRLEKFRFVPSLLASLVLGGVTANGCYVSPSEELGEHAAAVDVAPPPRPARLCPDPVINDITCHYQGVQTRTLVGNPVVTKTGEDGKFVKFFYKQNCRVTVALMADIGEYCALGQIADTGQRQCDATADEVIPLEATGGILDVPETALAELKRQCDGIWFTTVSKRGKGACCPKPPLPIPATPPPLPFRPPQDEIDDVEIESAETP